MEPYVPGTIIHNLQMGKYSKYFDLFVPIYKPEVENSNAISGSVGVGLLWITVHVSFFGKENQRVSMNVV